MKKIVFCNVPMKKEQNRFCYIPDGNSSIAYDKEVMYPINGVLAKKLKTGDNVKVVLIKKTDVENNSAENVKAFQAELNTINANIGASISYEILETPFEENWKTQEKLFREILGKMEKESEVFSDITYGPKSVPIIMFSALNFAEKYFDCDLKGIFYGKVDFVTDENGKGIPTNPVLCDMLPLYYLNAVTNTANCESAEDALALLDTIMANN